MCNLSLQTVPSEPKDVPIGGALEDFIDPGVIGLQEGRDTGLPEKEIPCLNLHDQPID